jgi:hypothetical protein
MKSLILHIGIPKTGSSALQVFCAQNRKALLAQSLDYFELGEFDLGLRGKISSGNGAHLARSLLRPQGPSYRADREQQLATLERRIAASECANGLLSSEIFVFADDGALTAFAQWLRERGVELRFFYFIREQVEFLTSSYIQQVKRHACTETGEQYVLRVFEKIAHIKYSKLFERLSKFTPGELISCLSYDEARTGKRGICGALVQSLGLAGGGLQFAETSVNVSLNLTEIKIMRAMNKLRPRMVFSDALVENAVRRGHQQPVLPHHLLSKEALQRIERYFEGDNSRFARAYFARDQLFQPREGGDQAHVAPDGDPPLDEVLEVFGGLLVRFDERLAVLERRVNRALAESEAE